MKASISRGNGFRGAVDYVLGPGEKKEFDRAELIGGNMAGQTPRELAAEFRVSRELRPKVKNPVWHCSLSLPPGEKLTPEKWNEAAELHLSKMKIDTDKHQYCLVRHSDTGKDHCHLIVSRIGLDSQLWHGRKEAFKAIKSTQEIEKEMGLQITAGLRKSKQKQLSKNEIEMSVRTGKPAPKAVIQQTIKKELENKPTTEQFLERMELAGVQVRPNIASTGRVSGLAFEYENITFKGSQLGKDFSWGNLQKKGLNYEQDRDSASLSKARERFDTRKHKGVDRSPEQFPGPGRHERNQEGLAGDQRPERHQDRGVADVEKDGAGHGKGTGNDKSLGGIDRPDNREKNRDSKIVSSDSGSRGAEPGTMAKGIVDSSNSGSVRDRYCSGVGFDSEIDNAKKIKAQFQEIKQNEIKKELQKKKIEKQKSNQIGGFDRLKVRQKTKVKSKEKEISKGKSTKKNIEWER